MNTLNKITTTTTTTYSIESEVYKGFYVDIVNDSETYSAFLYHKNYGIKSLVFGVDLADTKRDDFLEMVQNTIADYIADYISEYMQ